MSDRATVTPSIDMDRTVRLPGQPSLFGDADMLGYEAGPVWDEMVTGGGRLRPHWQAFLNAHGPFAPDAMTARWGIARRMLFQHGVTYTAYGDPLGVDRPWPLDPIPFLLPQEEFKAIEAGLVQRARILERVLADLFGPQALVADGTLPPALLHADPSFLRPCHGTGPAKGCPLVMMACDLVRGPDGRWRVLATRTQSPSGFGYALENRTVLFRTLPDAFRQCNAERIAPFFEALKDTLQRIAPRTRPDGEAPRLAILTPGPYNEAYFEHAFLARYLGLTLVEGGDLLVRNRAVYLKTLSGLDRIDVLLRRVDDGFCDPLELRADSTLGVPGLLEAARAGNVAVANPLGSGLTDSPAFAPFMPQLCRRLLDEDLHLEEVPTFWGGREEDRRQLERHADMLVLRPAFASLGAKAIFGPDLGRAERAAFLARLAEEPHSWTGQAVPRLSTAPVWRDDRLDARPLVLRLFLTATADGWKAMPGGLARISADARYPAVSLQDSGGAKDVWVVTAAPQRRLVPSVETGDTPSRPLPRHRPEDLPSRVADHLFWVGRYAERIEGSLRLLRAANARIVDDSRPGAAEELPPLLRLFGWMGMVPGQIAWLPEADAVRGMRQAVELAAFDPANPNGLRATVERLKRSCAGVRDRLSADAWRVVASLERQSMALIKPDPASLAVRFDEMATTLAALAGLEHDTMARGHGWRFLGLGRRMERAVALGAWLRGGGLIGQGPERGSLAVLLELAEAQAVYRERYGPSVARPAVLEIVLADDDHPRSMRFQLDALAALLERLPGAEDGSSNPAGRAAELIAELGGLVRSVEVRHDRDALGRFVDTLDRLLPEASNLVAQAWFSHSYPRAT